MGNDWTMTYADFGNSCLAATDIAPELKLQWTTSVGKLVSSVALGAEQCIIVALRNGMVKALSMNGELGWKNKCCKNITWLPVIHKGRVYVPGKTEFCCLDLQTGEELWTIPAKPEFTNLTINNYLEADYPTANRTGFCSFIGETSSGTLLLKDAWGILEVEADTGVFIRNFYKEEEGMGDVTLADVLGNLAVFSDEKNISVCKTETFEEVFKTAYKFDSPPYNVLCHDSLLFLTQWNGIISCDLAAGKVLWKKKYRGEYDNEGRTATDGENLYISTDQWLRAYSGKTGKVVWEYSREGQVGSFTRATLAVTNTHLLHTCRKANQPELTIQVFDKQSGELVAEPQADTLCQNGVSIIDGKVFVLTEDSVMCFA